MELQLAVVRERIEDGRKAAHAGETDASEIALREAMTLRDRMQADLLQLDAQVTLLERDIGVRLYPDGSPWKAGFADRKKGILPQSRSEALYLRGWEIADRLIRYGHLNA